MLYFDTFTSALGKKDLCRTSVFVENPVGLAN